MSFFKGVMDTVHRFKDAVKAGGDFNPMLEKVIGELEDLHSQGKLDDVVYKAEQTYTKEHGEYLAKGTHTNALDSKNESNALKHFLAALKESDVPSPEVHQHINGLLETYQKMQDALGPLGKLF